MPTEPSSSSTPSASSPAGEPVRQLSIFLQNRAGTLLGVVRLINDALVDVLGLSLQDSIDGTVVRLIVSDPETVEEIFMEKGIPCAVSEMVVVELTQTCDLGSCLAGLLMAETNVHFCYPLLVHPNSRPALALYLEDAEIGASVLSNKGFRLLLQSDLSR